MAAHTLDSVVLPALSWVDEFEWSSVKAQQEFSLGGGLVIQESQVTAGRPVTLESGEDYAWVQRSAVELLLTKLNTLGAPAMVLTLADGRVLNVKFDRSSEPLKATPVLPWKGPAASDHYKVTLKFIQV